MVQNVMQFYTPDLLEPNVQVRRHVPFFASDSTDFVMQLLCLACLDGVPGHVFIKNGGMLLKPNLLSGKWSLRDFAESEKLVKSVVFALRFVSPDA